MSDMKKSFKLVKYSLNFKDFVSPDPHSFENQGFA